MEYCYTIEIFDFNKERVVSASFVEIEVVLKLLEVYKACPNIVINGNCKMEERTTEWIPVSEILPDYGYVIITHKGATGRPITSVSYFEGNFKTEDGEGYFCDVIAWKPLPAPYKAE